MVFRTAITGSFLFISLEKEKKKGGGASAREDKNTYYGFGINQGPLESFMPLAGCDGCDQIIEINHSQSCWL